MMDRTGKVTFLTIGIISLLVILIISWTSFTHSTVLSFRDWKMNEYVNSMAEGRVKNRFETSTDTLENVINQRNEVSALLNRKQMELGRMYCEQTKDELIEQGGWCKKQGEEDGGQHVTDMVLVPTLSKFLKGKSVASFGDGPGAYKREILKLGEVAGYDAFDGAPYCEITSQKNVRFLDLSVPQFGLPVYDWIISLEVAEHIPKKYEAIYLDNIFRHAREGIILSWATADQLKGLGHVNPQELGYVIDVMNRNGFRINNQKSKILQDSSSLKHIIRNIRVFIRDHVVQSDFRLNV